MLRDTIELEVEIRRLKKNLNLQDISGDYWCNKSLDQREEIKQLKEDNQRKESRILKYENVLYAERQKLEKIEVYIDKRPFILKEFPELKAILREEVKENKEATQS